MKTLRDFQKTIFDKLVVSNEHISLLDMPCGCGKGELYCHYATMFDIIVIMSPLKQHVDQNIKRLKDYLPDHRFITFDSDYYCNMTNINIHNVITQQKRSVIGITYCAYERGIVSFQNIKQQKSLIICDEVHNVTKYECIYRSLFSNFSKVLLSTATPNETNIGFLENRQRDTYYLSVGEAIEKHYITDYKIFIPQLDDNLEEDTLMNTDYETKVKFMKTTINKTKCKKIIVYLYSITECDEFIECCKSHIEGDYWYNTISCHVDLDSRKKILDDFQNNDKDVSILCSIHILDECIDIPKCDGVFLININQNDDIKLVQRVFRSMRLDSTSPDKIATIMLWSYDIDMACNILNILKEKDNRYCFHDKINVLDMEIDNNYGDGNGKSKLCTYLNTISQNENDVWNNKFVKMCEYSIELDRLPEKNDVYENINIGEWVHCQKVLYCKNMLPKKRLNCLVSISLFKKWVDMYNTNISNCQKQPSLSQTEKIIDVIDTNMEEIEYNNTEDQCIENKPSSSSSSTYEVTENKKRGRGRPRNPFPKDPREAQRKASKKWYSNPENRERARKHNAIRQTTPYSYALRTISQCRRMNEDPTSFMIEKYKLRKLEDGTWITDIKKPDFPSMKKEKTDYIVLSDN